MLLHYEGKLAFFLNSEKFACTPCRRKLLHESDGVRTQYTLLTLIQILECLATYDLLPLQQQWLAPR
jgi:hypothetical protein